MPLSVPTKTDEAPTVSAVAWPKLKAVTADHSDDAGEYASVVVWCRAFSVLVTWADLERG